MNCFSYALDRWHKEGGALEFVMSKHWGMPHVLHRAQDGTVTHYVPPRRLDKPVKSLFGFEGEVHVGDSIKRGPMPIRGIAVGGLILAASVIAWAIHRSIFGVKS